MLSRLLQDDASRTELVTTDSNPQGKVLTNGCPDRSGKMACNRPYGSYRPGEEYRDYPFLPNTDDLIVIRQQMRLDEVWSNLNPTPALANA